MRLDPGNFLLGHPANQKFEMGSGSERFLKCDLDLNLYSLDLSAAAAGAGGAEGLDPARGPSNSPTSSAHPAPPAPPALQPSSSKTIRKEGWRGGVSKALGAIKESAQFGRRAKKFQSGQPLIFCLERLLIEYIRRTSASGIGPPNRPG